MILLDTNALLWFHRDSPELGADARKSLADTGRAHYSAVSVMEISIKHMLGRLDLPGGEEFPHPFDASGLRELPFRSAHAATLLELDELARHDPFDRMLLAQAKTERMILLTSDAVLLALDESWIQDARL